MNDKERADLCVVRTSDPTPAAIWIERKGLIRICIKNSRYSYFPVSAPSPALRQGRQKYLCPRRPRPFDAQAGNIPLPPL